MASTTTYKLGEEPVYSTDALGEEDPVHSTDAIGEEDPNTTMTSGEEEALYDGGTVTNPFGAF